MILAMAPAGDLKVIIVCTTLLSPVCSTAEVHIVHTLIVCGDGRVINATQLVSALLLFWIQASMSVGQSPTQVSLRIAHLDLSLLGVWMPPVEFSAFAEPS
jgi:hypothetical protein